MEFSARQIADVLSGTVEGNPEVTVSTFSKIEEGKPGSLSFLANPKYEQYLYHTEASIVLVNHDFAATGEVKSTLVRVPNAYAALATLLQMVEQMKPKKSGIASSAFISSSATTGESLYIGEFAYIGEGVVVGDNCRIYPHAYIGDHVRIGNNTVIYPHVTVYDGCVIGNDCILHAGAVVGSDGFGFAPEGENYTKIPQLGNVILEDRVEVGANTAIDRAVMGSTIIHQGVKLDNLIQIAHNVEVGENTVMAAQAGIAGSAKVGKNCMLGGQVGLAGHLSIADKVTIAAQSGVISSITESKTVFGSPAIEAKRAMRSQAIIGRLPDMYRTLGRLERELEELKKELKK